MSPLKKAMLVMMKTMVKTSTMPEIFVSIHIYVKAATDNVACRLNCPHNDVLYALRGEPHHKEFYS